MVEVSGGEINEERKQKSTKWRSTVILGRIICGSDD